MKKTIIFIFALFFSLTTFAQLEVKDGSFKEVPGFVNINPDPVYQTDDNDLPFAVIKVKTDNINDKQRRKLHFEGNAGTFIMLEYKVGEVWVYLTAKYADYLKISHPDLSSVEFHFPYDLQPKRGYEMLLINKAEIISGGWASLTITTSPERDADIIINGRILDQKTPYTNKMIPAGKYDITVSKFGFENVTKSIVVNENQTMDFNIDMPYKYGVMIVESDPPGANVLFDSVEFGVTPIVLNNIQFGTHDLRIQKECLRTYKQQVVIKNEDTLAINVILGKRPEGAIDGLFSIGEHKHVYFSKGNLQYHIKKGTWRFAEKQWDYKAKDAGFAIIAYKGWMDLFTWGTGKEPTRTYPPYGGYSRFNDWGENPIINGENKPNFWRTLTSSEWSYILYTRSTLSGIRFARAIVNNVCGMIILPDNWNADTYVLNNTNEDRMSHLSYNDNVITSDVWNNVFETNGAVFLPAAGQYLRGGTLLKGLMGCYQTSTQTKNDYNDYDYNIVLEFHDNYIFVTRENNKTGCSVRLVCDVE